MADQIDVTLPDGSTRELPAGSTGADLATSIGRGLAKAAVAVDVDGHLTDLTSPLHSGEQVAVVTDSTPGAQYAIGPAI